MRILIIEQESAQKISEYFGAVGKPNEINNERTWIESSTWHSLRLDRILVV